METNTQRHQEMGKIISLIYIIKETDLTFTWHAFRSCSLYIFIVFLCSLSTTYNSKKHNTLILEEKLSWNENYNIVIYRVLRKPARKRSWNKHKGKKQVIQMFTSPAERKGNR